LEKRLCECWHDTEDDFLAALSKSIDDRNTDRLRELRELGRFSIKNVLSALETMGWKNRNSNSSEKLDGHNLMYLYWPFVRLKSGGAVDGVMAPYLQAFRRVITSRRWEAAVSCMGIPEEFPPEARRRDGSSDRRLSPGGDVVILYDECTERYSRFALFCFELQLPDSVPFNAKRYVLADDFAPSNCEPKFAHMMSYFGSVVVLSRNEATPTETIKRVLCPDGNLVDLELAKGTAACIAADYLAAKFKASLDANKGLLAFCFRTVTQMPIENQAANRAYLHGH
ncbi:MAG: hypothetical protein V1876_00710, partial [Candidatus Peregrinibacteria bacterium]